MNTRKMLFTLVTLLIQCLGIAWLIWRYENIVRNGTEVRFRCEAYDPYDPLRGRYLNTTVRETCTALSPDLALREEELRHPRKKIYVKLEPGTNGLWRVASATTQPQLEGVWIKPSHTRFRHQVDWGDRGKDEPFETFKGRRKLSPLVAEVDMPGILFVNERIAPKAEKVLREATSAKGKGAVAVYRVKNKEIVLTDIEIEGKSLLNGIKSLETKNR